MKSIYYYFNHVDYVKNIAYKIRILKFVYG